MFTYAAPREDVRLKRLRRWEGLCRFAHEDMNPVPGWNDDKHC